MADIDEELRLDAEENQREVLFIQKQLPTELKGVFTDSDLLYLMDCIVDYYYDSGMLEDHGEGDDAEVEIDLEQVAEGVLQRCKKEGHNRWTAADLFFVVQADLDFMEQSLD